MHSVHRLLFRLHRRHRFWWAAFLALALMALLLRQLGRHALEAHGTLRLLYTIGSGMMLIAPFFEWFIDDREWLCYRLWGVDLAEVLRRKSRVLLHQQGLLALAVLGCWTALHPASRHADLLRLAALALTALGSGPVIGLAVYPGVRRWLMQAPMIAGFIGGGAQLLALGLALLSYLQPLLAPLLLVLCWYYGRQIFTRSARALDQMELPVERS